MRHRLPPVRRGVVVLRLAAVLAVTALAAPVTTAWAAGPDDDVFADRSDDGYAAGARSVTVSSTFGGTTRSRGVPAPPPACRWSVGNTATDFNGIGNMDRYHYDIPVDELHYVAGVGYVPLDFEERRAAEIAAAPAPIGRYWSGGCYSADFPGDVSAFLEYTRQFFAATPPYVYYLTGTQPPVPPLGVAELLDVATEYIEAPVPEVGINPTAFSVVNLDTWVWAEGDTFTPGTIRAESGPNWVEIDVTPQRLQLAAPYARQSAPCLDGGTPWTAAATDPTCAVTFSRAPAGGAALPLSVTSLWTAQWRASDGTSGADLPGTSTTTTVLVDVQEVQAVVTSVR